jgi:desulfoferrodoxin-like iron-binding protein
MGLMSLSISYPRRTKQWQMWLESDIAALNVAVSSSSQRVVPGLSCAAVNLWSSKNKTGLIFKEGGAFIVANQLGKRYRCPKCGTEILCTKAGNGEIVCCTEPMKTQEAKPIPSSD